MTTPALAPTPPPAARTDGSLVRRYRNGEETAATDLYRRYARRLRALAAKHCRDGFGPRFDADDIVQSVFHTFFRGVRRQAYDVPPGGEIWGLLMVLALNQVRSQADFHRAAKRSVYHTADAPADNRAAPAAVDDTAAVLLRMVLDEQLAGLPESNRAVIRMRMDGYEVGEIAAATGRSRRTVERVLQEFRARLTES